MKATGVLRCIDYLGRIVLTIELTAQLGMIEITSVVT